MQLRVGSVAVYAYALVGTGCAQTGFGDASRFNRVLREIFARKSGGGAAAAAAGGAEGSGGVAAAGGAEGSNSKARTKAKSSTFTKVAPIAE